MRTHPPSLPVLLCLAACNLDPAPQATTSGPSTPSTVGAPATPDAPTHHGTFRPFSTADTVIDLSEHLPPLHQFYPVRDEARAFTETWATSVHPQGTELRAGPSSLTLALTSVNDTPVALDPPTSTTCPPWQGEACRDAVVLFDPTLGLEATWSVLDDALAHTYVLRRVDGPVATLRFSTNADVELTPDGALLFTPSGDAWHHSTVTAWDATGKRIVAQLTTCDADLCLTLRGDSKAAPWTIDPLLTPPDTMIEGYSSLAGIDVSTGGDVDGDGVDDLLIAQTSRSYLYYGSPTGVHREVVGAELDVPGLGNPSTADLGDLNGDGFADAAVSAINTATWTYLSRPGGLQGESEIRTEPALNNEIGTGYGYDTEIADVTGDGYADVVVSRTWPQAVNPAVDIWPGSPTGVISNTPLPRLITTTAGRSKWGHRISTGDLNADGFADVIVADGGLLSDWNVLVRPNAAIYLGGPTGAGPAPIWQSQGYFDPTSYDPWITVAAPDLDGDGFDDILFAGERDIWWLRGAAAGVEDGPPRHIGTWDGYCANADCSILKLNVVGAGDVNGDGYGDLAVYHAEDPAAISPRGLVDVLAGSPAGPVPNAMWTLESGADGIDWTVPAAPGDLNGDGYNEIGVSYPEAHRGNNPSSSFQHGHVALWNGRAEPDMDGDSYPIPLDCHPYHPSAHPGATEVPGNLLDDDCDGSLTCFVDADGDGTAGSTTTTLPAGTVCADAGYFATADDCHDDDPALGPHALEVPHDDIDQDCDGFVACIADLDGDGFGGPQPQLLLAASCSAAPEVTTDTSDCDDTDPDTYPLAPEVIADGIDQDCDGLFTCWFDDDSDGYGDGIRWFTAADPNCPVGTRLSGDCDDQSPLLNPSVTDLPDNTVDENCDGKLTCWRDRDEDGWGGALRDFAVIDCQSAPEPTARQPGDCNDLRSAIYPGAAELPGDYVDQNCDGIELCYQDIDDDGWGSSLLPLAEVPMTVPGTGWSPGSCGPFDYSNSGADCNDNNPAISPGRTELVGNTVDENCDDRLLCQDDTDNDGHGGTTTSLTAPFASCLPSGLAATDCDDTRATVSPSSPEVIGNNLDDNCDGLLSCYRDADRDGAGSTSTLTSSGTSCDRPNNNLANDPDDCRDNDPTIHPDAREVPNDGTDQDCDGIDAYFLLVEPLHPVPGGPIRFTVRGAPSNATLRLIRSTAGPGQGPCPAALNGGCAGLLSPELLLSTTAAANGTLVLNRTVPAQLTPGTTIGFQVLAQVNSSPAQGTPVVAVRLGP